MRTYSSAAFDRGAGGFLDRLPRGSFLDFLFRIAGSTPIAIAVAIALLPCFGLRNLSASTNPPPGLDVHRSTRTVPRHWVVHPDGATVTANQTQRFEVTDAQGNPVAVRWNVSGMDCFDAGCGTIDDQGVYRTPSVPKSRVVILEAVLISNPNYSVLTQIRLVPSDNVTDTNSPNAVQAAAAKPQPLAAPRENLARGVALPPIQNPISAAPVVGRQPVARHEKLPPLPNVISAAPVVGSQSVARNEKLPPLPVAISAPPAVGTQTVARGTELPPLPNVISAAPVVGSQSVARNEKLPPLPIAIGAPPAVGTQTVARSTELPPLPNVIGAAPLVGTETVAHKTELPPLNAIGAAPVVGSQAVARHEKMSSLSIAIGAAPAVGTQTLARKTELPPLNAIGAAPVVGNQAVARHEEMPPLSNAIGAAPAVATQVGAQVATQVGTQTTARTTELPPLANAIGAAPVLGNQIVENQTIARISDPPLLPSAIAAVSPASVRITNPNTPSFPAAGAPGRNVLSASLSPLAGDLSPAQDSVPRSTARSPVVTYRDGQLTIDAGNSTLAEVLKLVADKTGAVIDVPPGTGQERIFEHTGPGRADDVVARLLNGSAYDFIIVGSPQRPHELTQVLLSLRQSDSSASSPAPLRPPVASSSLWTPPKEAPPAALIVPIQLDNSTVTPPTEAIPPEQLGKMMLERAHQLREQLQQQQPQQ